MPLSLYFEDRLSPSEAERWLFAVPDGDPLGTGLGVMLSAEIYDSSAKLGRVRLARLDPLDTTPFAARPRPPAWTVLGGEEIDVADHWHLFTDGAHWLSRADSGRQRLRLCRADVDPALAGSPAELPAFLKGPPGTIPPAQLASLWFTNDHFMVRTRRGGVHVGLFDTVPPSLRLVRCDDAMVTHQTRLRVPRIGAAGDSVSNTASARRLGTGRQDDRFVLVAPDLLTYADPARLRLIEVDPETMSWAEVARIDEGPEYQLQMGTVVFLPGGRSLVTYKRLEVGWRAAANEDDGGNIRRVLFDAAWGVIWSENLLSAGKTSALAGNRPHTITYDWGGTTYVLSTWDEWNLSAGRLQGQPVPLGCRFRVDAV